MERSRHTEAIRRAYRDVLGSRARARDAMERRMARAAG